MATNNIEFLLLCGKLKGLKRTGWVLCNVQEPETVASHMHRMALFSFLIPDDSPIDRNRCIRMALVHDLAESIVGDITPHCGVSEQDKHKAEFEAIQKIISYVSEAQGKEILTLWQEYEDCSSPEAKYVKDFDRLDMVLQAATYEKEQGLDLPSFFASTKGKMKTELGVKLYDEILQYKSNH